MPKPEGIHELEQTGLIELLKLNSGVECEIYLPESHRDRLPFENEFCQFTPVGWARLEGTWHPLGYKVVTEELQSLGLRKNPNILTFPVGRWVEEKGELIPTEIDYGGIWTALRKGSIKTLQKHCQETWEMKTKGYLTAIYNPVFVNSYRIKSQAVMLLRETGND